MISAYLSWPGTQLVWLLFIVCIGLAIAVGPLLRFNRAAWTLWWALGTSLVLMAGVKTLDLLRWELPSLWRQIVLVATIMIITAVGIGLRRLHSAFLPLSGLWPSLVRPPPQKHKRGALAILGAAAILAPASALVLPKGARCPSISGCTCWSSIALVGLGLVAGLELIRRESRRSEFHKQDPMRVPAPSRNLWWTVSPPWALLTTEAIAAIVTRHPLTPSALPTEKLGELVFVTVLGEELIFRGFSIALALLATSAGRTSGSKDRTLLSYWLVSLGFGLWHVGDAVKHGQDAHWPGVAILVWSVGTILGTTLASRFVLIPLRMRTGTVAAPALVHLGANAPGILFGL